jgi:K+-sensing histidine kinase KdpD
MDTLPSQTEDKVENGRNGTSPPQPLEVTADITGTDLKYPPRRAKRGIPPTSQRGKEYGIAIGTTLLAFLLRLSLNSYLEDRLAYTVFLVAIAVTTWYGGIGPSLVAVVLGGLIANWVFIQPTYSFSFKDLEDQAGIAVYLTVSYALVGFAQTWRWAWRKTEEMTQELRMEMDRHRLTEEKPAHVGSTGNTSAPQREYRL